MKTMKNTMRKFVAMLCLVASLCSMITVPSMAASSKKCYLILNQNTTVYSNTSLTRKCGSIYGSDEITVLYVSSSYCKVSYPVTGTSRSKTGYIRTSAILTATRGVSYTAKAKLTTYKRPGGYSYGYISSGDKVLVLGTYGNYTQVKYPVSGGYKYAFVSTSLANTYIKGSGSSSDNKTDTGAGVQLNVPSYKQYDSRWKNTYIGTNTIGKVGCLVSSLAMKYSYHNGTTVYPNVLKNRLKFSNNDLYWSSVSGLGYTYTRSYGCGITNNIMSLIYSKLKAGRPVIIGGKKSNGSTHYVIITGYTGSNTTNFSSYNFKINDPNSSSRTTLAQFLSTYPTVLRLIY